MAGRDTEEVRFGFIASEIKVSRSWRIFGDSVVPKAKRAEVGNGRVRGAERRREESGSKRLLLSLFT